MVEFMEQHVGNAECCSINSKIGKLIDLQGETKKRSAEEEAALKELFGLKR